MTDQMHSKVHHLIAAAVLLGVALFVPGWMPAYGDSAQASKLLQQARTSAVQLKNDSAQMEAFSSNRASWESHARQINQIKEHINNSGKILADLHDQRDSAEPWQQEAIDRITPLLKDLASNTESIIDHLNDRQATWHPEYTSYLKSNAEMAADLSNLIRDYLDYGEAKARAERIGAKIGFSES